MTKTEEDGWQELSTGWPSYDSISWAYSPPNSKPVQRPPHRFQVLAFTKSSHPSLNRPVDASELELNTDHVGVKVACDTLSEYERNVGFEFGSETGVPASNPTPNLARTIGDDEILVHRKRWEELMRDLLGEAAGSVSDHESEGSMPGLSHSATSLSSLDLAEWEHVLSTPKPSSLVNRSCYSSPSPAGESRSKLNVFASSFTPLSRAGVPALTFSSGSSPKSTASSPSPPLNDFIFPSPATLSFPKMKLEKDDQGFFTGIEEEHTPKSRSSALLPAFLQEEGQRRRTSSKTRAMVDRLRSASQRHGSSAATVPSQGSSSHSPSPSPSDQSHLQRGAASDDDSGRKSRVSDSSLLEDDTEGWIGLNEMQSESSATAKAQRRRDLFMALTKHNRSDSTCESVESQADSSPKTKHSSSRTHSVSSIASSSMPPTPGTSSDGWIEGPALTVPQSQSKPQPQTKKNASSTRSHRKRNSSSVDKSNQPKAPTFPTLNTHVAPASGTTASRTAPHHNTPHPHNQHHSRPNAHTSQAPSSYVYGYPPAAVAPVHMGYPPYAVMPYAMHAPPQHLHQQHHQRTRSMGVPVVGYMPAGMPFMAPHPQVVPLLGPVQASAAMRPGLVAQW